MGSHKFKLTTQQETQILNDINVRKKNVDFVIKRFTKYVGSPNKRSRIISEIMRVMRYGAIGNEVREPEKYDRIIGSKKEPYFKTEDDYIFPNYKLKDLIDENPSYLMYRYNKLKKKFKKK